MYAYIYKTKCSNDFLIGMYHANTDDKIKEKVLESLVGDYGNLPVINPTTALGCGIDFKDIEYFCPSLSLVDYCQQISRAGRNLKPHCDQIVK